MAVNLVAMNSTPEEEQQKMLQQLNQSKAKQGQPQVNLPQQQGPLSMIKDMATNKAMSMGEEKLGGALETGLTKGKSMFQSMFAPAAPAVSGTQAAALQSAAGTGSLSPGIVNAVLGTGAATPAAASTAASGAGMGAMAGLGAAVPYIGAGLLAGKAFGLFDKGGKVDLMQDPLATYKEEGGLMGPLALRKIKYKQDGGKVELELSGE